MTYQTLLKDTLAKHNIAHQLPTDLDEAIYRFIYEICFTQHEQVAQILNQSHLNELITIAPKLKESSPPFYYKHFELEDTLETLHQHNALNADTFNALLTMFELNISLIDIALCFAYMNQVNLLSKNNVTRFTNKVLSLFTNDPWVTQKIQAWLHDCHSFIGQDGFDFLMDNEMDVYALSYLMQKLHDHTLYHPENLKAAIVSESDSELLNIRNQDQFNTRLLQICDQKLQLLHSYSQHRVLGALIDSIYRKLQKIKQMEETETHPHYFLYQMTLLINTILHHSKSTPDQNNIEKLFLWAENAAGHPSLQWQELGLSIALLGMLMTVVSAIAFNVFCLSMIAPVGIGCTVGGAVGVVTGLVGLGLFAHACRRTDLSLDLYNLADHFNKNPEPLLASVPV